MSRRERIWSCRRRSRIISRLLMPSRSFLLIDSPHPSKSYTEFSHVQMDLSSKPGKHSFAFQAVVRPIDNGLEHFRLLQLVMKFVIAAVPGAPGHHLSAA